jgi:hypothetical protein
MVREESIDQLLARSEIDEELEPQDKQTIHSDIVGSTTYFDRFGDTEGLLFSTAITVWSDARNQWCPKTIGDSVMASLLVRSAVHKQSIRRCLIQPPSERASSIRIGIMPALLTRQ